VKVLRTSTMDGICSTVTRPRPCLFHRDLTLEVPYELLWDADESTTNFTQIACKFTYLFLRYYVSERDTPSTRPIMPTTLVAHHWLRNFGSQVLTIADRCLRIHIEKCFLGKGRT
jgi:hypothetical protein